jgi:hypothetical protein
MRAVFQGGAAKFATTAFCAAAAWMLAGPSGEVLGQPINPEVYRKKYEEAAKTAEVVAKVRVLSAVCTAVEGEGKGKTVTLQLSLRVLDSEKASVKKNDVLVVVHKVRLPAGPGPGKLMSRGICRRRSKGRKLGTWLPSWMPCCFFTIRRSRCSRRSSQRSLAALSSVGTPTTSLAKACHRHPSAPTSGSCFFFT